jgi:hypothetical protein
LLYGLPRSFSDTPIYPEGSSYLIMSAAISSILYALSYARITISGHEPWRKETLIRIMDISQTGGAEERIAGLEKRMRDIDALVNGLMAELLDMKAVSTTMTRQNEERNRQDLTRASAAPRIAYPESSGSSAPVSDTLSSSGGTIIRQRTAHQPEVPAAPAEPQMVRIMQTDGTMKMEARYGDNRIDSSLGYGRNNKGAAARTKQNPLIYAADKDDKADSKK